MISKRISWVVSFLFPLILTGMEPQHQTAPAASSTSSITTATASSTTPQQQQKIMENFEQEFCNYLEQEVVKSKNDPQYKNYLMYLLSPHPRSEFNENIKHLNDDLTNYFATIYSLLALLIKHGQYDYLDRFFKLVDQSLINFKVNHCPHQKYSLIFLAYFYATENSKNPDVYFKIIDLLINHGASTTQRKMIYRSVREGYVSMIQGLIKIAKLKDGLSYFSKDSPEQELINAVKTADLNLFKKTLRLCYSADIIDEQQGKHILSHAVEIRTEKNKEIIDQMIMLLFRYGHINLNYVIMWGDVRALTYVLQHPIKKFSSTELTMLITIASQNNQVTILKILQDFKKKFDTEEAAEPETTEPIDQRPMSEQWFKWAMQHYNDENVYQKIKSLHPTFSNEELDFWHAVASSENDKAIKILQSNPGVRLIMPHRPYPEYNILTYCLTLQEGPNTDLINYLLEHHQHELYSLICDFIKNNKVNYFQMLLECGLMINDHPLEQNSLLFIALFAAYKLKDETILTLLLQAGAHLQLLRQELTEMDEDFTFTGDYLHKALHASSTHHNPCLILLQKLPKNDFSRVNLISAIWDVFFQNEPTRSLSGSTSSQTTQAASTIVSASRLPLIDAYKTALPGLYEIPQHNILQPQISPTSLIAQLSMMHLTSPKS